ncbi:MAG: hypothetical protein H6742_00455 [Alphaproteobacteria bacterium]|nr:hypothetical protein [Alphaproteobacteria bacterium]
MLWTLLLLLSCADKGGDSGADGVAPGADKPALTPFPSAHFVGDDGHLALPAGLPMVDDGTAFPVERLTWRTGFSVVQTTVIAPEVALDGASLPGVDDLGAADASVQLWDLDRGERLLAFAELDAWCDHAEDDPACAEEVPTLLVRPMQPMPVGHRVAVVVTNGVRTAAGEPWAGPAWFSDLLAGRPGEGLAEWEAHYAGLVEQLQGYGVAGIVLAVDFPVGDGTAPTRALAAAGSTPTAFAFDRTRDADAGDSLPDRMWKQAEGSYTVDAWLVDDTTFALDAAGVPALQGSTEADLYVIVPDSVRDAAAGSVPVWIFGHGIFSKPADYLGRDEDSSAMIELADRAGAIIVATTWRGLTQSDLLTAVTVGNDFGRIPELTDKLAVGVGNTIALRRLLTDGDLLADPFFEGLFPDGHVAADTLRYHGISLGGIEGATFLALDPAVPHGVLHVGGSTWSTMLERSSNWPQFEILVADGIPSPADRQLLYAASQLFWDQADPAGYVDDLAGRSVLWQESMGDEQVPNITTESIARGAGATLLQPSVSDPWALDPGDGPLTGPAVAQFDPQVGRPPQENRPAEVSGAHATPRTWEGAIAQSLRFLDPDVPGVVEHFCGDAPCTADNTGDIEAGAD